MAVLDKLHETFTYIWQLYLELKSCISWQPKRRSRTVLYWMSQNFVIIKCASFLKFSSQILIVLPAVSTTLRIWADIPWVAQPIRWRNSLYTVNGIFYYREIVFQYYNSNSYILHVHNAKRVRNKLLKLINNSWRKDKGNPYLISTLKLEEEARAEFKNSPGDVTPYSKIKYSQCSRESLRSQFKHSTFGLYQDFKVKSR